MEHKESKAIPKDAQVIQAILKDLGIQEYESRVVKQLLEFTYRYATSVLDEAQVFSQYAKKKTIDADDVKLAIQFQVEKMYSSPPPRDLLLDIARNKNAQCLPPIKSSAGTRLPPDRYSLTSCNYRLKPSAAIRQPSYSNMTTLAGGLGRQTGSLLSAGSSMPFSRQTIQMQMGKSSISRSVPSLPIIKQVETKNIGDSTGLKRKHEEQEP